MTVQELIAKYHHRKLEAERIEASAPLAKVYDSIVDELQKLDGIEHPDRFVGTEEAAEILSLVRKTCANWCAEGRFPNAVKTSENGEWRIPVSDVYGKLNDPPQRKSRPKLWEPDGS